MHLFSEKNYWQVITSKCVVVPFSVFQKFAQTSLIWNIQSKFLYSVTFYGGFKKVLLNQVFLNLQPNFFCRKDADPEGWSLSLQRRPAQPALLLPVCRRGLLPWGPQHSCGGSQDHPLLRQPPLHAAVWGEEPVQHPRRLHPAAGTEPLCSGDWGSLPLLPPWCPTLCPSSQGGGEGFCLLLLSPRHPPLHLFRYLLGTDLALISYCLMCITLRNMALLLWDDVSSCFHAYFIPCDLLCTMEKGHHLYLTKIKLVAIPDLMGLN